MNRDALEKILELHDEAGRPREVDGITFLAAGLKMVLPDKPREIGIESLPGVVDYIYNNKDGIKPDELTVVIVNPRKVVVCGSLKTYASGMDRARYVVCAMNINIASFAFDAFMDHETFVIKLMTMFVWDEELKKFLATVQKVKAESINLTEDDGTTMRNTKKEGIDINATREIVKLRPFRTFAEAEQPQSSFIFRASNKSGNINLALFDCDGGAWINVARQNIKKYLENSLPKEVSILA